VTPSYVQGLLNFFAVVVASTPHLEFYLRWVLATLQSHNAMLHGKMGAYHTPGGGGTGGGPGGTTADTVVAGEDAQAYGSGRAAKGASSEDAARAALEAAASARAHALGVGVSLMPTFRALQKSLHKHQEDLTKLCDENKYTLGFLSQLLEHASAQAQQEAEEAAASTEVEEEEDEEEVAKPTTPFKKRKAGKKMEPAKKTKPKSAKKKKRA
jgi:hypothetical protein